MPTDPRTIKAEENAHKAVQLRRAGASYPDIAKAVGYAGPSSAYYAVSKYLERIRDETEETAAELRQLELERLDLLWAKSMPGVLAGSARSIEVALKVSERRSKMQGLDDYEARMAAAAERNVAVTEAQAVMAANLVATAIASTPGMTPELRAALVANVKAQLAPPEPLPVLEAAPDDAEQA